MDRIDSDMENEIVRMLSDDMSDAERGDFRQRCHVDAEFRKCYEEMKKIWDDCSRVDVANRINERCEEEWAQFRQNCFGSSKKLGQRSVFVRYWKVAAVFVPLFILGALGFLFFPGQALSSWSRMATNGYVDSLLLEDQTFIVLNKSTAVEYLMKEDRRVVRLEGMAYFNVAKDKKRPFVVQLNNSEVKVLGTAFFIENIKDRNRVVVEVTEGRVEFGDDRQKVVLTKGQKATLEHGVISRQSCDVAAVSSWRNGKLTFQGATLREVSETLMKFYPEIKKVNHYAHVKDTVKVTTVFDNQPLSDVLEELKIHFSKKIQFSDGELTISD